MRKLDCGWQYTVSDLENGRVLKRMNSPWITYSVMLRDSFPYIHHPLWRIPRLYRDARVAAISSLSKLKNSALEPWMHGNAVVRDEYSYEQDKVVPLRFLLKKVSAKEGEKIIDAFVAFNKVLIEKTFIDKSFDMGNNFGLDALGRIVLIDLGEIYTDMEAIRGQIKKRIWSAPYVLSGIPRQLHAYFLGSMDKAFGPISS